MSVVAVHFTPSPDELLMVLMKEFTIRGSFEYPQRFEDAIELLERRDLSSVVTHTLPLDDFGGGLGAPAGLQGLRQGPDHDRG